MNLIWKVLVTQNSRFPFLFLDNWVYFECSTKNTMKYVFMGKKRHNYTQIDEIYERLIERELEIKKMEQKKET